MLLAKRKSDEKPKARPLTDYERLLETSRQHMITEGPRAANQNRRQPAHRRRSGGFATFFGMLVFAVVAAAGTQYYLGLPTPERLGQGAQQFVAGANDFFRYLLY
jgi:hypothetical protein